MFPCSLPKLPCATTFPQFFLICSLCNIFLCHLLPPSHSPPQRKFCRGLIFRSNVPSCSLFPTIFSFVPLFLKTPGRPSLLPSPNFDAVRFHILHSLFHFLKVGKFVQGETKIDRGEALYLSFFLLVLCSIFFRRIFTALVY